MAGPNVSAAVTDVVEPEVRSSGDALLRIFEYGGSSAAPLISGYLADKFGLGMGILCVRHNLDSMWRPFHGASVCDT